MAKKKKNNAVSQEDFTDLTTLLEQTYHKIPVSIVSIRDRLDSIHDLISICIEALESSTRFDIRALINNVLMFQVQEQIKLTEKELANL